MAVQSFFFNLYKSIFHTHLPVTFVTTVGFLVLYGFYDVHWWPMDDGVFAHLAERVLNGDVYGVDVYDFHGGYHTLLNTLMFNWFGIDVAVLRYPLVILGTIQAGLITFLLRSTTKRIAITAGLASVVFGFLQFPNPSPNWYALFFAIVIIYLLAECRKKWTTFFLIGLVLGICFMFRHPSAIFLTMGVLAYLIYDSRTVSAMHHQWFSKIIISLVGVGIIFYSVTVFEPFGFALFGLPPLVFSYLLFRSGNFKTQVWLKQFGHIVLGGVISILPMFIYQLLYGNLISWINQSFIVGSGIVGKTFFSSVSYADVFYKYAEEAIAKGSFAIAFVEIGYWIIVFIIPILFFLLFLVRWKNTRFSTIHPAVFITIFYGLVSFYHQISFYYFISFILFLVSIVLLLPRTKTVSDLAFSFLVFITVWGLASLVPGFESVTQPEKYTYSQIPNVNLTLKQKDHDKYIKHIYLIQSLTDKDDVIYVFPFNPDLYFVSERKNPFPYLGSIFIANSDAEYELFLSKLKAARPTLLVFDENNAFTSDYDRKLFTHLQEGSEYVLADKIDEFWYFIKSN